MTFLTDSVLRRLQEAADLPDLSGTRYRLLAKLGQGGMSGVFRVEDTVLGREVALKVISVPDREGLLAARLAREARIIAQLEHPGVVPVHDAGTLADGRPFYTMKLIHGKRLDEYGKGIPRLADRMRIFLRICEAVAFAHAHGILHRDLKPGNIMVGPFGEILVMDWGLSKIVGSGAGRSALESAAGGVLAATSADTAHGAVLGTPGYMAPEQAAGDVALDQWADVYSLGAILQSLLAEASSGQPRALRAVSGKAMNPDREQRYADVENLAADVTHFLDGFPVSAWPENIFRRSWRWATRNRAWILLLLTYVIVRTLLILWRPG
jgi:eukaryotic-like serine/threonine-protein kinase